MRPVAALFVRKDSCYKSMPSVDCWDIERDARRWPGGAPVVAHPPCRAWGSLRMMAKPRPDEPELARWAVAQVRTWGGVLEHPAASILWADQGLGTVASRDAWGGWTLPISQSWFGHRAEKLTNLYIVGIEPRDVPVLPFRMGHTTHVITVRRTLRKGLIGWRPEVSRIEREATPPAFAEWLVELARRCVVERRVAA